MAGGRSTPGIRLAALAGSALLARLDAAERARLLACARAPGGPAADARPRRTATRASTSTSCSPARPRSGASSSRSAASAPATTSASSRCSAAATAARRSRPTARSRSRASPAERWDGLERDEPRARRASSRPALAGALADELARPDGRDGPAPPRPLAARAPRRSGARARGETRRVRDRHAGRRTCSRRSSTARSSWRGCSGRSRSRSPPPSSPTPPSRRSRSRHWEGRADLRPLASGCCCSRRRTASRRGSAVRMGPSRGTRQVVEVGATARPTAPALAARLAEAMERLAARRRADPAGVLAHRRGPDVLPRAGLGRRRAAAAHPPPGHRPARLLRRALRALHGPAPALHRRAARLPAVARTTEGLALELGERDPRTGGTGRPRRRPRAAAARSGGDMVRGAPALARGAWA